MKITFDFKNKFIEISEDVDLLEFVDKIKGMISDLDGWKLKMQKQHHFFPNKPYDTYTLPKTIDNPYMYRLSERDDVIICGKTGNSLSKFIDEVNNASETRKK